MTQLNAASEKSIARGKATQSADRETDRVVITTLMSTISGRRWLWLKLSEAQLFSDDGLLDHAWMAFTKGRRIAALSLLNSIQLHAPAMYIRMTEENTKVTNLEATQDDNEFGNPDE